MYALLKPLLFKTDPETIHHRVITLLQLAHKTGLDYPLRLIYAYAHPALEQTLCGITFKNPVGLAAGFDKNAQLPSTIHSIGFGHEEVGSVTAEACAGNAKPRVWRWPEYQSIIVYYGLCNDGADIIRKRLQHMRPRIPIGVSIAKTNRKMSKEEALSDWETGYAKLKNYGHYTTLNISCPNSSQGQAFDRGNDLTLLLDTINNQHPPKPVFLKLTADYTEQELKTLFDIITRYPYIKGLIISNLTKQHKHPIHPGGLSGTFVRDKSLRLVKKAYELSQGKHIIIGCGGIFTAEDAYERIKAGANLVQLITGMIYNGPATIKRINQGLVKLLARDGHTHISQAVGTFK